MKKELLKELNYSIIKINNNLTLHYKIYNDNERYIDFYVFRNSKLILEGMIYPDNKIEILNEEDNTIEFNNIGELQNIIETLNNLISNLK